jgi:hypothetical protein
MANIHFFQQIFLLDFVPDVKIRTGAKYFGCVDNMQNILNLWVGEKERPCRLMAENDTSCLLEDPHTPKLRRGRQFMAKATCGAWRKNVEVNKKPCLIKNKAGFCFSYL